MKDGKLEPEEMDDAFTYARLVMQEADASRFDAPLTEKLARALVETSELCLMTRCVYCDHTLRWDSIAQRRERGPVDLAEHVIACEKRPELRLMMQVAAAEGELKLAREVVAAAREVQGFFAGSVHGAALRTALENHAALVDTPVLSLVEGLNYHCNICGGDVDLSNATAPTVKWGGHPNGKRDA